MDILALREQINSHRGEYMDESQISLYKSHLISNLTEAQASLNEQNASFGDEQQRFADPSDFASHTESEAMREAGKQKLVERIEDTQAALRAIREDEYGYCAKCGEEIGHPRMLSVPHSLMDAECANKHEVEMKIKNGR